MQVAIVGTGYVGLVSGVCLADTGHRVVCIDKERRKIEALGRGELPIFEPGLDELLGRNLREGRLSFTSRPARAIQTADIVILAVGTPPRAQDGYADLTFVYDATRKIAPHLSGFTVVAVKSTVPIGTCDELERIIAEQAPGADVAVVSNPEFLREGAAVADFMRPDRIVVGTEDPRARAAMAELYAPLAGHVPVLNTGRRTSELIKYASNAFLATKITFINELADLCEQVGAEVDDVARGMGLDDRIGPKFLRAGPGFGGSCFPKDTQSLAKTAQDYGVTLRIVEAVASANDIRRRAMVRKVARMLNGEVRGARVGVLGLAFKSGTDDVRDSPAVSLIGKLCDLGATVRAYDPAGMANAEAVLPAVDYCADPYECAADAAVLVIATDWDEFRTLDLPRLKRVMARAALVDLRNLYDPAEMSRQGFAYDSIGRSTTGKAGDRRSDDRDLAELVA